MDTLRPLPRLLNTFEKRNREGFVSHRLQISGSFWGLPYPTARLFFRGSFIRDSHN